MSKFFYVNYLSKHLFLLLGLFIPISVAVTNFIIVLISCIWVLEGNFKQKINQIKSSKWLLSIFALICLYFLGMFWGDNHTHSNWLFQRLSVLLFFPVLITLKVNRKTIKNGLIAFLFSTFFSALIALLINYKFISPLSSYFFFLTENKDISAFLRYNYHNVLLAFSCIIYLYLFIEKKTKHRRILIFFFIICLLSLFTEIGRAGQLLFNFIAIYYIVYYARKYSYKLFLLIFLLFLFQFVVYKTTKSYKNRVDTLLTVVKNNGFNSKQQAMDTRYVFVNESLKRILAKPILGYGSGSFGDIFEKEVKTGHNFSQHKTPHNQYLYVWFEIGFIGLILLLMVFIFQINEMYRRKAGEHKALLPASFMFLMLVDSYLFIFTLITAYIYLYKIFSYQELE